MVLDYLLAKTVLSRFCLSKNEKISNCDLQITDFQRLSDFSGERGTFQCHFLKLNLLIIKYIKIEKYQFSSRVSPGTAESNFLSASILQALLDEFIAPFFIIFPLFLWIPMPLKAIREA